MVLQKCEELLAVCLISLWRDVVQTRLEMLYYGHRSSRSCKPIRTITSRQAGSKVPANVRYSLYRYEIEMYFSGFCKVFAAT